MSGKLDQSLDDIVSTRRSAGPRRGGRRAGRGAAAAPAGGIAKNSKPAKANTAKAAPTKPVKPVKALGESKVIVSNMPKDVSEGQIKEYFQKAVGTVKRVELSYGPGGVSRGIASVIFQHSDGAKKAFTNLNGLRIDNRPIKVEVVVSGDLAPAVPTLSARITQPKGKAAPKSAAADKPKAVKAANGKPAAGAGATKRQRGKNARPVKKSAEELDTEMADYFVSGNTETAAAPATTAAAATGDSMEDEVL